MNRFLLVAISLFTATSAIHAWNNKGHMTVARVAWNELTPAERSKIVAILKTHPHFEEFLNADRPSNFTSDEWVFLRAATWADWVRSGPPQRRAFNVPMRHFIDYPIIGEGFTEMTPVLDKENAVNGITEQLKIAKTATDRSSQLQALTWVLHLLGDIHQPLHAATRYSANFPKGDRGGNLALVRIEGRGVIQLHHFWDGLLGNSVTRSSILGTAHEVESLGSESAAAMSDDLATNTTPEQWAKESNALAVKIAYLNGKLEPANSQDHPDDAEIPLVKQEYAENAGETARMRAYKGGKRLAAILKKLVRE